MDPFKQFQLRSGQLHARQAAPRAPHHRMQQVFPRGGIQGRPPMRPELGYSQFRPRTPTHQRKRQPPPQSKDVKPIILPKRLKNTQPSEPIDLCTPSPSPSPPTSAAESVQQQQQQQQPLMMQRPVTSSGEPLPWWDTFLDGRPNQGPAVQTATHPLGVQAVAARPPVQQFVQTKPALMPSLNQQPSQMMFTQQQNVIVQPSPQTSHQIPAPPPAFSPASASQAAPGHQSQSNYGTWPHNTGKLPALSDQGYIEIGPTNEAAPLPDPVATVKVQSGDSSGTQSVATPPPSMFTPSLSDDPAMPVSQEPLSSSSVYIDVAVDYGHTNDSIQTETKHQSPLESSVTDTNADSSNTTDVEPVKKKRGRPPGKRKRAAMEKASEGESRNGDDSGSIDSNQSSTKRNKTAGKAKKSSEEEASGEKQAGRGQRRGRGKQKAAEVSRSATPTSENSYQFGDTDSQDSWSSGITKRQKKEEEKRGLEESPSKKRVTRSQGGKGGSPKTSVRPGGKSPVRGKQLNLEPGSKAAKARQISNTLQKKKKGAINHLHKEHGQQELGDGRRQNRLLSLRSRNPGLSISDVNTTADETNGDSGTHSPVPDVSETIPMSDAAPPSPTHPDNQGHSASVNSSPRPPSPGKEKLEKIKMIRDEIQKCKEMLEQEVAEYEKEKHTKLDLPDLDQDTKNLSRSSARNSPQITSDVPSVPDQTSSIPCKPFKREPVFLELDKDEGERQPLEDMGSAQPAADILPPPPSPPRQEDHGGQEAEDSEDEDHNLSFEISTNDAEDAQVQVVEKDLPDLIPEPPQEDCVTLSDDMPPLDVECEDVEEDWLANFSNVRTVAIQTNECPKIADLSKLQSYLQKTSQNRLVSDSSDCITIQSYLPSNMHTPIDSDLSSLKKITDAVRVSSIRGPPLANNVPSIPMSRGPAPVGHPGNQVRPIAMGRGPRPPQLLPKPPGYVDPRPQAFRMARPARGRGRGRATIPASSSTEVIDLDDSDEGEDAQRSKSPEAAPDNVMQALSKDKKTKVGISIQAIHLIRLRHNMNKSCNPEPRTLYMRHVDGQHQWMTVLAKVMNGVVKHQCALCPRDYPQPISVYEHMRLEHRNYLYLITGKRNTKQVLKFIYCRHCNFVTVDKPTIWYHLVLWHGITVMSQDINISNDASLAALVTSNGDLRKASKAYMCLDCKGVELNRTRMMTHVLKKHPSSHVIGGGTVKLKEIDLTKVTIKGQPSEAAVGDETLLHRSISRDCFVCTECSNVQYKEQETLSHMMDSHSDKTLLYICCKCEMRFDFPFEIASHIRNTHKESQKQHFSVTLIEFNAKSNEYIECDPSPKPSSPQKTPQKDRRPSKPVDPTEVVELDDSDDDLQVVSYKPGNKTSKKQQQHTPTKSQATNSARNKSIGLTFTPQKSTMRFNTNFSAQVRRVTNQVHSPPPKSAAAGRPSIAAPHAGSSETRSPVVVLLDNDNASGPQPTVRQVQSTVSVDTPPHQLPAQPASQVLTSSSLSVPLVSTSQVIPTSSLSVPLVSTSQVLPTTSLSVPLLSTSQVLPTTSLSVPLVSTSQVIPTTSLSVPLVSTSQVLPSSSLSVPLVSTSQVLPTSSLSVPLVSTNQVLPTTSLSVPLMSTNQVLPTSSLSVPPVSTEVQQQESAANVVFMPDLAPVSSGTGRRASNASASSLENEQTKSAAVEPPSLEPSGSSPGLNTPRCLSPDSQDDGSLLHRSAMDSFSSSLDPESETQDTDELPTLSSYKCIGSLSIANALENTDKPALLSDMPQGAGHKDKLYQGVTMTTPPVNNVPDTNSTSYVNAFENFLQSSDNSEQGGPGSEEPLS